MTGPRTWERVAYSRSGTARVLTEGAVPPAAYGEPGAPATRGTAFQRSDLPRLEVRDRADGTLLTIPA